MRDEPRLDLVVGQRARAARSRGPARASPITYSALRREKPDATSSSSRRGREPLARRKGVGVDGRARRSARSSGCGSRTRRSSETCCAVIDVTSDSNGSGASGGRKPAQLGDEPRRGRVVRLARTRRRRRGRTRRRGASATTGSVSASSGSTSTPPGADSIRTSRPPTTRCRPPSCQRFARSGPNARKRSVESSKSYGCGRRRRATRPRAYPRGAWPPGYEVGGAVGDRLRRDVDRAGVVEEDLPLVELRPPRDSAPGGASGSRFAMKKPPETAIIPAGQVAVAETAGLTTCGATVTGCVTICVVFSTSAPEGPVGPAGPAGSCRCLAGPVAPGLALVALRSCRPRRARRPDRGP